MVFQAGAMSWAARKEQNTTSTSERSQSEGGGQQEARGTEGGQGPLLLQLLVGVGLKEGRKDFPERAGNEGR